MGHPVLFVPEYRCGWSGRLDDPWSGTSYSCILSHREQAGCLSDACWRYSLTFHRVEYIESIYMRVCIYLTERKGLFTCCSAGSRWQYCFTRRLWGSNGRTKKTIVQFLVKQQEGNELFDAVNIGFARFLWHTWKIKLLKHCQVSSQKQTKKQNKKKSCQVCPDHSNLSKIRRKKKDLTRLVTSNVLYRRK